MGLFARRLDDIAPSPIAVLSQRARELKAQGFDVIDLGVGEPDFDTPEFVKQAVVAALARGETKYTPTNGGVALREAICAKFARDNALRYIPEQIAVSGGAKQIIFNAMMATLDPGDEVILPAPYWTSYPEIVRIAGGVPVFVACSEANGFRLAPADLAAVIGPRTKWLFLNSPGNPSGAAYGVDHLRALADVLLVHPHVWVMSDDIYEHLLFDGRRFTNIVQVEPSLFQRTLTLNGVSKTYAMTGWRLGYAGAPEPMIRAMSNVQTQSTTHASSLSQAGALAALTGPQDFLVERVASFQARRDLIVQRLNDMVGLACLRPEGAFYVFPSCRALLGRDTPDGKQLHTDQDLARYLLDAAQVSLVPGTLFGTPGYLRISTAADIRVLGTACDRIEAAVKRLQ